MVRASELPGQRQRGASEVIGAVLTAALVVTDDDGATDTRIKYVP